MIQITPIDKDPQYVALTAELTQLEKRLDKALERRLRAESLQRGVPAGRSPLQRAADLLKGGQIPAMEPRREIEAADREIHEILRPAIRQLSEQLDALRGDLSWSICQKLRPEYIEALRAVRRAIEDMNTAAQVAAGIRAKIKAAGFDSLEAALPSGLPPACAVLGNGRDGLQVQRWLQYMEEHSGVRSL
jgi:hypothetical protein